MPPTCRVWFPIIRSAHIQDLPRAGASIKTLRIALTKNLGTFVGRTIPVVGWLIIANDVIRIMWNSVAAYNAMVSPNDRLEP